MSTALAYTLGLILCYFVGIVVGVFIAKMEARGQ